MDDRSTRDVAPCLVADVGKTNCRVAVFSANTVEAQVQRPGLAAHDPDATGLVDTIMSATRSLPSDRVRTIVACGVGAAGLMTDPAKADSAATQLAMRLHVPVALTSDAITAHLGAFCGGTGVVLIAGTGAVAIGIDDTGELRRADGLGPDLGDLGSGAWIGRRGMAAIANGESSALAAELDSLTSGEDPGAWVDRSANRARQQARFAPAVLSRASAGDQVALTIVDEAVVLLVATTAAARGTANDVVVTGGLAEDEWFRARLEAALTASGFTIRLARSTALQAASLLTTRNDLPHERYIHRA
jgi:glucosamine kinase